MKLDEFGAYIKLLVEAWLDGARLPNDMDELRYDILNIDDDKQWLRVKKFVVDKMFVLADDNRFLINEHQVNIWNEVLNKHLKNKSKATKAAKTRWENKPDAPSMPDAIIKHGNQSQSQNQSQNQSQLVNIPANWLDIKTSMEMAGWTGDFEKLVKDMGSFECVENFWNDNLSQRIKTVSQDCKGGFITKRFYSEAVEWYRNYQQAKEQTRAEREIEEQRQAILVRGASLWSLSSPEEKQKVFEQVKKQSDLIGKLNDGEISNPMLKELVYEHLAMLE